MKKKQILTLLCSLTVLPALAQMDNVVEVENTYTPVVKDANKINVLPEVEKTNVPHYPVKYTDQAQPASSYVFQPTEAAQSEAVDEGAPRGFATIGAGVRGNLNIRGAYGLKLSNSDLLDFDLSLRGYKGRVEDAFYDAEDWSSRFFTTRGAVGYEHRFERGFSLRLKGNVESQVFNYFPDHINYLIPAVTPHNKQHNWLTEFDARITPIQFGKFTIYGNLGYNSFIQKYSHFALPTFENAEEVQIWVNAGSNFLLEENEQGKHLLGLDLRTNFTQYDYELYDNNNSFTFVPYYEWAAERFTLHAGVQLHLNSGFESRTRLAPDVHFRYHATEDIDLFARLDGGEVRNEFRRFSQITPCWALESNNQMAHQFDRFRTLVGVDWKLMDGLFARLYAGYDRSRNRTELYGSSILQSADGSLMHINADFTYQYQNDFAAKLKCQFNGWETKADKAVADELLSWRPIFDIRAEANYRVWKGLSCGLDYVLQTFAHDGVDQYKRPATNNLGASVTYTMPVEGLRTGSVLSFYLKGHNLLNQDFDAYKCYRAQRISFLAGVALTF